MKTVLQTAFVCLALSLPLSQAFGQTRTFRAERIVLDDNNGNTLILQTPAGPITGGTLTIPDPGGAGQFLISNPAGGSQSLSGDLLPGADDIYDLGSGASRWQNLFTSGNVSLGGQVQYVETGGGTDYVGFQAPAAIAANQIWTLPAADGTAGQAIVTDGAGNLGWTSLTTTVSTDASLTGDGSGGSPLGIDLTHANSWSATQTFTDADVNGGSIDGTAIGSASPSTGSFTTITGGSTVTLGDDLFPTRGRVILHDNTDLNGFQGTLQTASVLTGNRTYTLPDASGTIALVSDISTTTNSTLLGDGTGGDPLRINLSNANTWTGTQTFGQVAVLSIATFDADMALGDSPTDAITMNGTLSGATPLSFEGASSDVNETTFAITDPTADRTITFQDASGTVAFLSDVAVTTNSTLLGDGTGGDPLRINLSNANTWTGTQTFGQVAVLSISTFDADMTLGDSPTDAITMNGTLAGATPLSFEGASSDVNETTFAITDPTADRTITFQDASGTVAFLSDVAAVTSDATLTGDGSGGSPLGIDLSNANTWTGAQTFSSVDINGGTIDGTVIGGATPAAGSFTTLNAAGAMTGGSSLTLGAGSPSPAAGSLGLYDGSPLGLLGTIVVGGLTSARTYTLPNASGTVALTSDLGVTTDGTLTGDGEATPLGIDLSNANTWTGTQTFAGIVNTGTLDQQGNISSSTGDVTVNDNFTVTSGSIIDLQGIVGSTGGDLAIGDAVVVNSDGGAGTNLRIDETSIDRSSAATETLAIDNTGTGDINLLINGATSTTNSRLTVNEGHWTSEQATAPTGAGTVDFAATGASVTVSGTDVAGQIDAVSGASTASSTFTVTFDQAYGTAPIVVVTPANANAYTGGHYVSATGTTSFTVTVPASATSGTGSHLYNYHVIEVQ